MLAFRFLHISQALEARFRIRLAGSFLASLAVRFLAIAEQKKLGFGQLFHLENNHLDERADVRKELSLTTLVCDPYARSQIKASNSRLVMFGSTNINCHIYFAARILPA